MATLRTIMSHVRIVWTNREGRGGKSRHTRLPNNVGYTHTQLIHNPEARRQWQMFNAFTHRLELMLKSTGKLIIKKIDPCPLFPWYSGMLLNMHYDWYFSELLGKFSSFLFFFFLFSQSYKSFAFSHKVISSTLDRGLFFMAACPSWHALWQSPDHRHTALSIQLKHSAMAEVQWCDCPK